MHRSEEKLCLKWNDFQDNITSAFGERRQDRQFADVTLACDDGQQVDAHKVILASSSPFFLDILTRNKHPHTLIYMRGMKSEDLVAIVDFLYFGEANVFQENLDSFLAIAEELKLKGLTGNQTTKRKQLIYLFLRQTPKKSQWFNIQRLRLHQQILQNQLKLEERRSWQELLLWLSPRWLRTWRVWMNR